MLKPLKEALLELTDLTEKGDKGEIIISHQDGRAFNVLATSAMRGLLGIAEGKIRMADDFDEPLEDFEAYSR